MKQYNKKIITYIAVVAVVALSGYLLTSSYNTTSEDTSGYWKNYVFTPGNISLEKNSNGIDYKGEEVYWGDRIETVGSTQAYDELIDSVKELTALQQHTYSHIFGAALYNNKNIESFSTCDSHFYFGCFHEMTARAIIENGLDAIGNIGAVCENAAENKTPCEHGVGHGVLQYIGYEEPDLKVALEICDDLKLSNPIGGCYGGVFMEYSRRLRIDNESIDEEKIYPLPQNPIEPCNKIDEQFRSSCMFYQSYWWRSFFPEESSDNVATQLGRWCFTASEHKSACFQGIGNTMIQGTNFDINETVRSCDKSTTNANYNLACRLQAFVTKGGLGGGVTERDITNVCSNLDPETIKTCQSRINMLIEELSINL